MLPDTGTEEISHSEMLATTVALNPEGHAPKEQMTASDSISGNSQDSLSQATGSLANRRPASKARPS